MKKGRILKIRLGHNPNSSSHSGELVFSFLATFGAIANIMASIVTSIILYFEYKKRRDADKRIGEEVCPAMEIDNSTLTTTQERFNKIVPTAVAIYKWMGRMGKRMLFRKGLRTGAIAAVIYGGVILFCFLYYGVNWVLLVLCAPVIMSYTALPLGLSTIVGMRVLPSKHPKLVFLIMPLLTVIFSIIPLFIISIILHITGRLSLPEVLLMIFLMPIPFLVIMGNMFITRWWHWLLFCIVTTIILYFFKYRKRRDAGKA